MNLKNFPVKQALRGEEGQRGGRGLRVRSNVGLMKDSTATELSECLDGTELFKARKMPST